MWMWIAIIVTFLLALTNLLYEPWINWWKVSKNDLEKTVTIDIGGTELRVLEDLCWFYFTPEEIAQRTQDVRYHFAPKISADYRNLFVRMKQEQQDFEQRSTR